MAQPVITLRDEFDYYPTSNRPEVAAVLDRFKEGRLMLKILAYLPLKDRITWNGVSHWAYRILVPASIPRMVYTAKIAPCLRGLELFVNDTSAMNAKQKASYARHGKWTMLTMFEKAPKFAHALLEDLMTDKIYLVTREEEEKFGAVYVNCGFKLRETHQWHVYKRVSVKDHFVYEYMYRDGKQHGLDRIFYDDGGVNTSVYKNGVQVGLDIQYDDEGKVLSRISRGITYI